MEEIKSPCVSICALHDGICQGCGRTQEEISEWWDMTNAEKQQVLAELKKRQNELFGD